ncbi:hypothetical protein [Chthonobacter rhizosphaerae]|uniref:hypothetical protein n=1 Tax=Chthonobacter rhizosphaerae TaxID=2735553 RepID=UPI0015EF459B|nr:hypothetical protein [Chthonobacter rhizosphaerae]
MDVAAIAAFLVAAKAETTRSAVSTEMTRQALKQGESVVSLLSEGLQAAPPAGMGQAFDRTV